MIGVGRTIALSAAIAITAVISGCSPTPAPAPAPPTISTEGTPTGAVLSFHEAWDSGDCDLFEAVTTEFYRTALGPDDCDVFAERSAEQSEWGWQVDVTDESVDGDAASVSTTESWTESDGVEQTQVFEYSLVLVGDDWVIDDLQ